MFEISIFNKVSDKGLCRFGADRYQLKNEALDSCDGILLRSQILHEAEFPSNLKAIARAGAGTNNIPIQRCTDAGIVVFNTPGANANAVMELTVLGLLLSSRRVTAGIQWAKTLEGDVDKQVEKGKKAFEGPEIGGKVLGVIGLGAIGVKVANMGIKLGMKVIGYDPYMSVKGALGLSWDVTYAESIDAVLASADYLTLHIPLMDKTKGFIDAEKIAKMKDGARLLNLSRGGLVNTDDVVEALNGGKLETYVTDFPNEKLIHCEKAMCIPHLGASTPESEENCAVMAVDQLMDYLEDGNIVNSVNFPTCTLERQEGTKRLTITNRNVPNMIGSFTSTLAKHNVNIVDMINKSRGDLAYNIIDINNGLTPQLITELEGIEGIIRVRVI